MPSIGQCPYRSPEGMLVWQSREGSEQWLSGQIFIKCASSVVVWWSIWCYQDFGLPSGLFTPPAAACWMGPQCQQTPSAHSLQPPPTPKWTYDGHNLTHSHSLIAALIPAINSSQTFWSVSLWLISTLPMSASHIAMFAGRYGHLTDKFVCANNMSPFTIYPMSLWR